jgi:2-dehydropantoate 2-reductase
MKIVMLGAGAMGSLFGALLSRSGKGEVWLLDIWEEHINQVKSHGLVVESEGKKTTFRVNATVNPLEIGLADLVIVFVKAYSTKDAVAYVLPVVGKDTLFLSLQNGLGNAEIIASLVGTAKVVGGVTSQGSTLLGPGRVRHGGRGPTFIGPIGWRKTPILGRIASLLSESGIGTEMSDDVEPVIWQKVLVNAGINPLTAMTGLKNGELLEFEETRTLLAMVVNEAEGVALKKGIPLEGNTVERVFEVCKATAQNRSSMGQDIDNRRRTEIDFINGAIVKEGKALRIPTPVNTTLTYLIKTIEAEFRTECGVS